MKEVLQTMFYSQVHRVLAGFLVAGLVGSTLFALAQSQQKPVPGPNEKGVTGIARQGG
jgi:hypothetical protein